VFPSPKLILSEVTNGKGMLQSLHKLYSVSCVTYVTWNQGP